MTTGHGQPDGKLWKYDLGPDTLVGPGILLGRFPASLDLSPDGLYSFSANFNLHGEMVPSSISVVYTPTMTEVAQIETCTMPHGSRLEPGGTMQYSGCMMDDQLVEIDARTFTVARRFSLAKGKEGPPQWRTPAMAGHDGHTMPMPATGSAPAAPMAGMQMDASQGHGVSMSASCSPTWAQPSADGKVVFVACNKADEIVAVDRSGWSVTQRLKTGRGPYNLAVTPDGKHLVATLKQGAMIEIFDPRRRHQRGTHPDIHHRRSRHHHQPRLTLRVREQRRGRCGTGQGGRGRHRGARESCDGGCRAAGERHHVLEDGREVAAHGDTRETSAASHCRSPGTVEGTDRFAFGVTVKDKQKGYAWVWMERVEPKTPKVPNPAVLAIRVGSVAERDTMIACDPEKFFTEPHYANYPRGAGAAQSRELTRAAHAARGGGGSSCSRNPRRPRRVTG